MDQIFFPFAYVYLHEFGRLPQNGLRTISNHSNFQNIHAPNLLVMCAYTRMLALTDRSVFFFCTISFHLGHQGVICINSLVHTPRQLGSYTSHCTWKVLEKCSTIPFVTTVYSVYSRAYIATFTFLQCILLM